MTTILIISLISSALVVGVVVFVMWYFKIDFFAPIYSERPKRPESRTPYLCEQSEKWLNKIEELSTEIENNTITTTSSSKVVVKYSIK